MPKRILVSVFKYFGDVLLASPVISELKRAYPDSEIDVALFEHTRPMLEGHPDIKNIFSVKKKLSVAHLRLGWKVYTKKYDISINLLFGAVGNVLGKMSRAPIRVGHRKKHVRKRKKLFITHLVQESVTPRHVVEQGLDTLRVLDLEIGSDHLLSFHIPEGVKNPVSGNYCVLHPCSSKKYKNLKAKLCTELIQTLIDEGRTVVITGGGSKEETETISQIAVQSPNIINLNGKLSIKELGRVVADAEFIVTVDTMTLHLASALQTPTVAVFGPSNDIRWGPWMNPRAEVVRMDLPCKRCDQLGCGNSNHSKCLETLPLALITRAIKNVTEKKLLINLPPQTRQKSACQKKS